MDAELLKTVDTNEILSRPRALVLGTGILLPAEDLQDETWPQERPRASLSSLPTLCTASQQDLL